MADQLVNARIDQLPLCSQAKAGYFLAIRNMDTNRTERYDIGLLLTSENTQNFEWVSNISYILGEVTTWGGRWWQSQIDPNLGHVPGTDNTWLEVSKSPSGFVFWQPGIYTEEKVFVINTIGGITKFYELANTTRPFSSTDFENELANGDWVETLQGVEAGDGITLIDGKITLGGPVIDNNVMLGLASARTLGITHPDPGSLVFAMTTEGALLWIPVAGAEQPTILRGFKIDGLRSYVVYNLDYEDFVEADATANTLMPRSWIEALVGSNGLYKGTFTTVEALESAYPVGELGWSADVDPGSGTPSVRYHWDADEGWVAGSGPAINQATNLIAGIMKLYTSSGANTDGTIDQNTITNLLAGKRNLVDVDRQAVSIVSTTLTLNVNSLREPNFDLTATATGNFTIAFSNTTNWLKSRLTMRVTGTINITMPSAVVMDLFEKSNGRWNDTTNILTIVGATASPVMLEFVPDSAGNIWCFATNRGL